MTVKYHKLNQVVTPIAVPDVVLLFVKMYTFPGNWYAAIDLANAFFSIPVNKDNQKQLVFKYANNIPSLSYLKCMWTVSVF